MSPPPKHKYKGGSVDIKEVQRQAEKEIKEEAFKKAVAEEKERLSHKKKFWDRVFPWTIKITKKGEKS